ncbi:MAG: branched-chain amino acid ABC transporter permease [Desulfovibrio sp.]|nr:branched-chain amino acid ABC transporter permease [Desulfovibrio sp.]
MSFHVYSTKRRFAALAVLAALCLLPLAAQALAQPFYIKLMSRVLIYALAATSLNLVIGFGGMISFGHAAFVGLGSYSVALLMGGGILSAWVSWSIAAAASALLALFVGAVSLRTRGVYFIMITLAFAQMLYYLFVSLKALGGDDGLALTARNALGFGIDLKNPVSFYYVALTFLALSLFLAGRLVRSRMGRVIEGIRENETRMEAIGYPVFGYKLACFVISGALAGLSGALLVNQTGLASPNQLYWTQSGMLLVMVVLGGTGGLYGGALGAALLLILEELLSSYTLYAHLGVGLALLAVVFLAPRGLYGLLARFGQFGRSRDG